MGDIGLLGSPFLLHVRLTLKKTVTEHAAAIDEIVEKAKRGYIPVSGFVSPGEKEVLRRLKAEPRVRFVKLVPFALPPRYDPSAEDSRELAADRLAIVSLQPETAAIRSLDIRQSQAAAHAFRANCLTMNDLAAALCGRRVTRRLVYDPPATGETPVAPVLRVPTGKMPQMLVPEKILFRCNSN